MDLHVDFQIELGDEALTLPAESGVSGSNFCVALETLPVSQANVPLKSSTHSWAELS